MLQRYFKEISRKTLLSDFIFISIVLFAIIRLLFHIWTLDKGLVFSDESYYLYLLKDLPISMSSSNFFKYFHNVFEGNIFLIRTAVLLVNIFSSFVFSFGLYLFFRDKYNLKTKNFLIILAYCTIGFHLCKPIVGDVFSYVTMNSQIMLLSLGFLFLALHFNNIISILMYVISGFIAGMLIFIMITNTPIIIFIMIIIYLFSQKYINLLYFVVGVFMSIAYYFVFVESLSIFYNNLLGAMQQAISGKLEGEHGITQMVKWFAGLVKFSLFSILLPTLTVFGFISIRQSQNKIIKGLIYFIGLLLIVFFYKKYIYLKPPGVSSIIPIFVVSCYIFISSIISSVKINRMHIVFLLVAGMTPICLTFGSDLTFEIRAAWYIMFIIPSLYLLTFECVKSQTMQSVLYILVILYCFNTFTFIHQNIWGNVYTEQKISVSDLGIKQSIKLDRTRFDDLRNLQKLVKANETVVLSFPSLWGYAYLLNMKPIDYIFIDYYQLNIIKKQTVYIEDTNYPFNARILKLLKENHSTFEKVDNKFNVYRIH